MPKELSDADLSARWDAQALMEAEIIKADPKRLKAAKKATTDLIAEKEAEAKGLRVLNEL